MGQPRAAAPDLPLKKEVQVEACTSWFCKACFLFELEQRRGNECRASVVSEHYLSTSPRESCGSIPVVLVESRCSTGEILQSRVSGRQAVDWDLGTAGASYPIGYNVDPGRVSATAWAVGIGAQN